MKKSFLTVTLFVVVSLAAPAGVLCFAASTAWAQTEKSAEDLASVAEWVLKEGLDKTLDEAIALRLGLGDTGIPIRHKGYRTTADDIRHAFAIAPKGQYIVLSALDAENNGYVWRTTRAGVLLMTLKQEGGAMKVVPNSQGAAKFAEEKQYFLSKIPLVAKN